MFPKKKKTPLPGVRRLAGQSLREEKARLFDDQLAPFYFTMALAWILWLTVEIQAWTNKPPTPRVFLALAIIATGAFAIVFCRLRPQFGNLNRGEWGELLVAEHLEDLREFGFRSFHDLTRDGFNVDHIVVGPPGVFVIETKYRSGQGLIEFRTGEGIFIGGRPEEGDSLKQARGNAAAVSKLLREEAGLNLYVKPLVVFVGEWKIKNAWENTDARVLAANQIPHYFRRQDQPSLKQSEIALICSHLRRSVKA